MSLLLRIAFWKFEFLKSSSFAKIHILSILFLATRRDPRKFPASTAVPVLAFPSSYLKVPNNKSYTEAYQKHTDCGYGYKVVCCYDDKYSKPTKTYRGEKAVYKFMEAMLEEVKYCKKVIKKEFNKPLRMRKDDEEKFQKAEECHICNKKYTDKDIQVRDHCHITGKYRGSAHQECNLKLRVNPEEVKIPVIFHNLRG